MLPKVSEKYQFYRDMALDLLDFEIDDNEHGRLHTFRVLMNVLMISEMKDLPESDRSILATAAIFHDTMRDNNGDDTKHGEKSAEYISLPTKYDIHEYKIMEDFIYSLPAGEAQNMLYRANKGKGAFRRFKDTVIYLGVDKEWYSFRDETYRNIALKWCREYGLEE